MRALTLILLAGAGLATTLAQAVESPFFRFNGQAQGTGAPNPSAGGNDAGSAPVAFTAPPSSATYQPGGPVGLSPPPTRGTTAQTTYALLRGGSDIGASLPSLCPGLAFASATGTISGTPTGACSLTGLTYRADTPGQPGAASAPFDLVVRSAFAMATQPGGMSVSAGATRSTSASLSGAPFGALTWSLLGPGGDAAGVPAWLARSASSCGTASLACEVSASPPSGTPAGTYPASGGFSLRATDASGTSVTSVPFAVTLQQGLVIAGIPETVILGAGSMSWTISVPGAERAPNFEAYALPNGFKMEGGGFTRTISGQLPAGAGTATVNATIVATDPVTQARGELKVAFTPLQVAETGTIPVVRSAGLSRKLQATATGGKWTVSPALPTGFSLAADGTLTGDPAALRIARTGPYVFTVENGGATAASGPIHLDVTGTVEASTSLPFMTADNLPAGHVASASTVFDPSVPAWRVFDGATLLQSSGQNTFWAAANNAQSGAYVKRRTPTEVRVGAIVLGARASGYYPDVQQSPSRFVFEGSNDDVNWTPLVSATSLGWSSAESKTFQVPVASRGYYRFHRISQMASSGSTVLAIDRLDFLLEK